MADEINKSRFESFELWKQKLLDTVEENIADYNPELREITELIKDESDRIITLKKNQKTISNSLRAIEEMKYPLYGLQYWRKFVSVERLKAAFDKYNGLR